MGTLMPIAAGCRKPQNRSVDARSICVWVPLLEKDHVRMKPRAPGQIVVAWSVQLVVPSPAKPDPFEVDTVSVVVKLPPSGLLVFL